MVALKGMPALGKGMAGLGAHICRHYDIVKVASPVAGIEGVKCGMAGIVGRDEGELALSQGQQQHLS